MAFLAVYLTVPGLRIRWSMPYTPCLFLLVIRLKQKKFIFAAACAGSLSLLLPVSSGQLVYHHGHSSHSNFRGDGRKMERLTLVILGCAVVTFLPRFLPMYILTRLKIPKIVVAWLSYIPVAVLAALVVPGIMAGA